MNFREYYAATGSGFSDKDAQTVGKRLDELGPTTAPEFVEDSRPDEAPTHELFEWDPLKAHPLYLEDRARKLMSMVRFHVVRKDGKECPVRAFHAVSHDAREGDTDRLKRYTSFEIIRKDPEKAAQVIDSAWSELQGWMVRHTIYRETLIGFEDQFGEVFSAIKEATSKQKGGRSQVSESDSSVPA